MNYIAQNISHWRFLSAPLAGVIMMLMALPRLARANNEAFAHSKMLHVVGYSPEWTDSTSATSDSLPSCHPSVLLEIGASSIIWGLPAYWTYRSFFDDTHLFRPELIFIVPTLFLPLLSLAPVAAWTSGCEANWWNSLWIGCASNIVCTAMYSIAYGHNHVLNWYKFNLPEYLALGFAPTVIASLVYNQFLHPPAKGQRIPDEGMYLLPTVRGNNSFALNFGLRF